jgi:hypothetical protein
MDLSYSVLEAIGFRPLGPTENVKGIFSRIDIFSIQGIIIDFPFLPPIEDKINGVRFKIGFGSSINEVCKLLVGDTFVDDEAGWLRDKGAAPPFVLIVSGPTDEYVGTGSHIKEDDDVIQTYDSFSNAKDELQRQADAAIPTLMTALSISFSSEARIVRFIPKDITVFGKSQFGKKIQDIRMKLSAEGFVSKRLDIGEISGGVTDSIGLAKLLDANVANFFYRGSNESDPLKRFIYFFIFVEQSIHSVYGKIDHHSAVDSLLVGHQHVQDYAKKLIDDHRSTWKDLRSRFTWCVMHQWTHLNDLDIKIFEGAKAVRDSITHGKLSSPDPAAVGAIEMLAIRIHQTT